MSAPQAPPTGDRAPPNSQGAGAVPALVAGLRGAVWLSAEGELESLSHAEAAARARAAAPLLCHARAATRRLGCEAFPAYDLLELFDLLGQEPNV